MVAQLQGMSAARTGGRQVKKAQLRRQAATAGVDVLTWPATQNRQQHELADAVGSGEVWPRIMAWGRDELERRLSCQHDSWTGCAALDGRAIAVTMRQQLRSGLSQR